MIIELKPISGKSPINGEEIRSQQLRIIADGVPIGVLSNKDGASPLISLHIPADQLLKLEVAIALKAGRPLGPIKQLPPIPKQQTRATADDL